MDYEEKNVSTKDESPIKTLVNMAKEKPQQSEGNTQTTIEVNSHANTYRIIAFAVIAIGFMAGLLCGRLFPTITTKEIGTYPPLITTEETFNFGLMFAVWVGTVFLTSVYWAIYSILDSMDNILIELIRANRHHEQNAEKE